MTEYLGQSQNYKKKTKTKTKTKTFSAWAQKIRKTPSGLLFFNR